MARKPKGFIAQLNSPSQLPAGKNQQTFTWSKPVAGAPKPDSMNMQRRANNQTQSPKGNSNLVKEQLKHQGRMPGNKKK